MSIDIENRVRDYAIALEVIAVHHRTSAGSVHEGRPLRRRARVLIAVSVAALIVAATVAIAVTRSDEHRSIAPVNTPSDESAPITSTIPSPTTSTSSSASDSSPTTTPPTAEPDPTTASTGAPTTAPTTSLEEAAAQGLPVALDPIPPNYRIIMANDMSSAEGGSPTGGNTTTLIGTSPTSDALTPYLQVSVRPFTGDPYAGLGDALLQTDDTVAGFTGRWASLSHETLYFQAPIDATTVAIIGGRATKEAIEAVLSGLTVRADNTSADLAVIPDGFQLIDVSPDFGHSAAHEYSLAYADGQDAATMIQVSALIDPERPAAMKLLDPGPTRIADIDGHTAFIGGGSLTFDYTPTYQIIISVGMPPSGTVDGQPINIDNTPGDQLIALAQTLVGIGLDQLPVLQAQAQADPLRDQSCTAAIIVTNAHATDPTALNQGDDTVITPGSITVDVSATRPTGAVTISVHLNQYGVNAPIATIDHADQTPQTVELHWDATINGLPAPAGTYTDLSVTASPPGNSDDPCTTTPNSSAIQTLDIGFEVK